MFDFYLVTISKSHYRGWGVGGGNQIITSDHNGEVGHRVEEKIMLHKKRIFLANYIFYLKCQIHASYGYF